MLIAISVTNDAKVTYQCYLNTIVMRKFIRGSEMDIAVIGSNMVDLITYTNQMPKEGETLEAPAFKIGCGGKGANQAVAAAKLNSKVLMLTKVGDDIFCG